MTRQSSKVLQAAADIQKNELVYANTDRGQCMILREVL